MFSANAGQEHTALALLGNATPPAHWRAPGSKQTPLWGQGTPTALGAMAADTGSPLTLGGFPRPVRLLPSAILQVVKVYGDLCCFAFLPHFFFYPRPQNGAIRISWRWFIPHSVGPRREEPDTWKVGNSTACARCVFSAYRQLPTVVPDTSSVCVLEALSLFTAYTESQFSEGRGLERTYLKD